MSMGFMVAAASRRNEGNDRNRMGDDMEMRRRRDSRGRYMDDDDDRRMGNDHGTYMGYYPRMGDEPEMRRRRDSRGRYMEGDDGMEMAYRPWPEPHMPPYLNRPDMNDRRMDGNPMRDRNVVNIRDYQDRRRIGFGENRMDDDEEEDMRQYGRRYNPDRMNMGGSSHQSHQMGHADYAGDEEHLSREEAEKWVRGMKSEDGKTGGRWPLHEIKQYAANFGIQGEDKVVEFFAVMNALATDYGKVAKKHGVDKVDFWADLAKAFIHDKDAVPGKVKMYYECIAKKDDE